MAAGAVLPGVAGRSSIDEEVFGRSRDELMTAVVKEMAREFKGVAPRLAGRAVGRRAAKRRPPP